MGNWFHRNSEVSIISHLCDYIEVPRRALPTDLLCAIAQRLALLRDALGLSTGQLAAQLGYQSASSLIATLDGRCALGIDKLALLAQLSDTDGRRPDLHWLLTGDGLPMRAARDKRAKFPVYLSPALRQALLQLLGAPTKRRVRTGD